MTDAIEHRIGVVVIGRNEGERLSRCLDSLGSERERTVYVDSGSTDGSVERTRARGIAVVELDTSQPFTAARARNAGLECLHRVYPEAEYVQFVDGDCEIHPGWFSSAREELLARPACGVVFGRLRERQPDATVYNRLCEIEWNGTEPGDVKACGGIAMMRVEAVRQVGGFNPGVLAAEDDELCVRLRQQGWGIRRLDAEMGWHDAAMMRFGQWWRRAVRCGWAYAQGADLHGGPPEWHFIHERRRALIQGGLIPLLVFGLAWPTGGWSLLGLLYYPYSLIRFYFWLRRKGLSRRHAFEYAVFCTIAKFAHFLGIVRYRWHRLRRGPLRLIEYK